jgi:hypothetical protein
VHLISLLIAKHYLFYQGRFSICENITMDDFSHKILTNAAISTLLERSSSKKELDDLKASRLGCKIDGSDLAREHIVSSGTLNYFNA